MHSGILSFSLGALSFFALLTPARAEILPSGATGETSFYRGKALVRASLVVDVKRATPKKGFTAGVFFKMAPGWHIYWKNPGDAGMPTSLKWSAGGVTFGEMTWPAPLVRRDEEAKLTTYEYGSQTLISVPVTAKVRRGRPDIPLQVVVKVVACKKICIPGKLRLRRNVPVAEEVEPLSSDDRWIFERFSGHTPRPMGTLGYRQRWTVLPADPHGDGRLQIQAEFTCRGARACANIRAPKIGRQHEAFALSRGNMTGVRVERIHRSRGGRRLIMIISADMDPELRKKALPLRGVLSLSGKGGQPLLLEVGGVARQP